MLTGRPEGAQIVAVEGDRQIVAVRSDVRETASHVERPLFLERRGQRVRQARPCGIAVGSRAHVSDPNPPRLADVVTELLEPVVDGRDPRATRAPQRGAMLGQRRFPHRNTRGRRSATARGLANGRVASREGASIALQCAEVAGRGQREHDVEKATPCARRTGDQLDVGRREHHRRECAECVAQPFGDDAVDSSLLALLCAIVADAELVTRVGVDRCGDVKCVRAEAHEVLVARASG